ncbi:MAG: hypothetical protein JWQ42_1582 [Edaphobacter sp.]|nr:hypothetical protein [Edaphobacter sp.]
MQPEENVGDGIRLGQEAGGVLGKLNPENGVWAPVSVIRRKDGSIDKYPHFGPDRGKPGSIIVDSRGHASSTKPPHTSPSCTPCFLLRKHNLIHAMLALVDRS